MEQMKMGATQNVYIVWIWLSANFWMELVHMDVNQGIEVLNPIRVSLAEHYLCIGYFKQEYAVESLPYISRK